MTTSESADRKHVRILGGGPAGLSAAFHLTSQEGWQERYDVTVYQLGWRLGGKGASGRNREACQRIEEHGIHLFGNMYANSLHMMDSAYGEVQWRKSDRITTMDQAFLPSNFQMLTDFHGGGWHRYASGLPHNDEVPWKGGAIASVGAILEGMIEALISIVTNGKNLETVTVEHPGESPKEVVKRARSLLSTSEVDLDLPSRALGWALALVRQDERPLSVDHHGWVLEIFHLVSEAVGRWMGKSIEELAEHSDRLYGIFIQIDLLVTCIRGFFEDDLLTKGIDSIDHLDYRDWLRQKGLSDLTLNSAAPQTIPNTCMQYPTGDSTVLPQMSAAAFMTFVLRQVVARGQGAYFFAVSTGETVILPLYRVLKQRGVGFEFFHKVTNLLPGEGPDGKAAVTGIAFDVQAHVKGGGEYQPTELLPSGEEVWPSQPLYEQLVEGDALRGHDLESWWTAWAGTPKQLDLDPSSDVVVVAMPIDCHQYVCSRVTAHAPAWRTMTERVLTTPTQQLQIWLDTPVTSLGWDRLEGTNRHLGPTFSNPLSAWGDFSDVIQWELWPDDDRPRSCLYFCGPLQDPVDIPAFSDHGYPERMKERVLWESAQYLRGLAGLLPGAWSDPALTAGLDFGRLVCHDPSKAGHGVNRLRQQYYRANIDPNERYTLSTPGSLQYRLRAWESGISNVVLCGDWCYTGFNIGSFEGAVMGGMLASHAITGVPRTSDILGYDFLHPKAESAPDPLLPRTEVARA